MLSFLSFSLLRCLFFAEEVYKRVGGELSSVHLEKWVEQNIDKSDNSQLLSEMLEVRQIVTKIHELRAKDGIKVRQPLAGAVMGSMYKESKIIKNETLLEIIKDEVNIKEIKIDPNQEDDIQIDTLITAALREEGMVRDLIRRIQELRKKKKLSPHDKISLIVFASEKEKSFVQKHFEDFKNAAMVHKILFSDESFDAESIILDNLKLAFQIIKIDD